MSASKDEAATERMEFAVDPFSEVPTEMVGHALSFGNFDGVHRGHARLIAALRERAQRIHRKAVVATFEPHPARLLRPERAPTPLVTPSRKAELLQSAGVDMVAFLRTTSELLSLTAAQFWEDVVVGKFQARALVEGHDFTFGKDRGGNVDLLRRWSTEIGMPVAIVAAVQGATGVISSSQIRKLLADGDLQAANELIGRPHRIQGTVMEGDRRGRTIGFPTANLANVPVQLPAVGVYAGWARIGRSAHPAACNIGPNPTFGVEARKVEIHILDFDCNLYGEEIGFDCVARLRDVRRFDGIVELKAQLAADVATARSLLPVDSRPDPETESRRELAQVIRQWFALHYATDEPEISGGPERIELDADGILHVDWKHRRALLPSDRSELLLKLDGKIRAVFPEIRRLELCLAQV